MELVQIARQLDRPLDNTALSAYLRCEQLYNLSMRQHRRMAGPPSPPLAFGTLWHTIMFWHYRTGGDVLRVVEEAHRAGIQHTHEEDHRTLDRAILEYGKYVKTYGPPEKEVYKTIGWPDQPMVELSSTIADDDLLYPYTVKIDRGMERDGEFFVEDYKTTSRWSSDYFRQYRYSNQMIGYAWGFGRLIGRPVAGVRINVLVIRKNDSQFEREIMRYQPWQIEEWKQNYNNSVRRINASYEQDRWLMNTTDGGCSGKYGMCHYYPVCTMRPGLREQILDRDYPVNPWNPLDSEDIVDV